MYQFRDLSIASGENKTLSVDDMKVNDLSFASFLKEYQQLTVEGREIIGREANYIEVPRKDGLIVNYLSEQKRQIRVNFHIRAETAERLMIVYNFLNDYLRRSDKLTLSFADDPDFFYKAIFVDAEISPLGLTANGTLIFDLYDPYRYGTLKSSTGSVSMAKYITTLPERIEILPEGSVDRIEVVNGRKRIVLVGSYSSPQKITIDFRGEDISIAYSGRSILGDLQLYSNLEDFTLSNGDNVTCRGGQITRLEWREKKL